jgi:hypothetical protein
MKLRYIGIDGLYELNTNQVYQVEVFSKGAYIYVQPYGKSFACPYASPKAFSNNWEVA